MALYLVWWPSHEQELHLFDVANVTELMDRVDEIGDPGGALYRRFSGYLSLFIKVEPTDVPVDEDEPYFNVSFSPDDTDGAFDMQERLIEWTQSQKGWEKFSEVSFDKWPDYIQKMHALPGLPQHMGVSLRPDHPDDPEGIRELIEGMQRPQ